MKLIKTPLGIMNEKMFFFLFKFDPYKFKKDFEKLRAQRVPRSE
jgi:hypothetical protein